MSYAKDPERDIAESTEAGREMLRVLDQVRAAMTGEQRLLKALELSETTRRIMRDGLRHQFPDATEQQIADLEFDQMIQIHDLPPKIDSPVRSRRNAIKSHAKPV